MYYISVRNTEISNHCELKGFTSKKRAIQHPPKEQFGLQRHWERGCNNHHEFPFTQIPK